MQSDNPVLETKLQKELMDLLEDFGRYGDDEGGARIQRLLPQVRDQRAVLVRLTKRFATKMGSPIDEAFLKKYLEQLTPEQVLLNVAPLCTKAAPGDGNAHRVILNQLAKKTDLVSDLYMEDRVQGISASDEEEVLGLVQALKVMDHRFYPQAVLFLADYFYRKSGLVKRNDEQHQLHLIENALQMILEVKNLSDYDLSLKDNIITAYANHFFLVAKGGAVKFMQASDVFAFISLDIENSEGLTVEWLKNMLILKQTQMVEERSRPAIILSKHNTRTQMSTENNTIAQPGASVIGIYLGELGVSANQAQENITLATIQERCEKLKACYSKQGKEDAETAKVLLVSFSEEEIISIFKKEMIIVEDNSEGIHFEPQRQEARSVVHRVEQLFLNRLQTIVCPTNLDKRLREIALLAVGSSQFKGHGYLADHGDITTDENYNKQEQRALMCIQGITDPKIALDLFTKCASQATDKKRLSGLMSELSSRIIDTVFTEKDNPRAYNAENLKLVHSALNYMIPVVSKIPVWSKSSDRSLMTYLKTLLMLFFTVRNVPGNFDENPRTLLNFFVAIQQLKQDTLNRFPGQILSELSDKVQEFIKECEKYLAQLYTEHYANLQSSLSEEMAKKVLHDFPASLIQIVSQDLKKPATQKAFHQVLENLQNPEGARLFQQRLKDLRLSPATCTEVLHSFTMSLEPDALNEGVQKVIMAHPPLERKGLEEVIQTALQKILQETLKEVVQAILQKDLMELVVGILSAPHSSQDFGGMARLSSLLSKISDRDALFKLWMKRLKTCDASGVNEQFLDTYLNTFTPERILYEIAPLCMEIKSGNGNTRRTIFDKLSAQIAKMPYADIRKYIKEISKVNEQEVLCTLQCLESLNHRLYPPSVLSLAEYFYTRSKYQREEAEQLRLLEISLKLILKVDDSFGYLPTVNDGILSAADLKAKVILAYGNYCFPEHKFTEITEVFSFIGIANAEVLPFDCLKNLLSIKQEQIAKVKKATRVAQGTEEEPTVSLDEEDVVRGLDDEESVRIVIGNVDSFAGAHTPAGVHILIHKLVPSKLIC